MLISVIVPIYNSEKFLKRCVDSILAQTYNNFELLLIDDGSTDTSSLICDEYAEKDSRIRVFHKTNGGVSSARNLGLDSAKGEWIAFVDSDDWIEARFLQTMIQNISFHVDLIVSSASTNKYLNKEEYINAILMRQLPPQLWGKLYRKNVLSGALNISRNVFWGEDLISNVMVGLNLRKWVSLINENLYNYDINDTSISNHRQSSLEYEEYFIDVLQTKMGESSVKEYQDALNYTKLYIIEDLIVCRQRVNYDIIWIKELREWGKANRTALSLRQKVVLYINNNIICRYVLALGRRLSSFNIKVLFRRYLR